MTVRVRFAPSPTGYLHVGGARTALYNYLYAKAMKGTFILRIEDTDEARSQREYEKLQIADLNWLGIIADEGPETGGQYGPYRQSERKEIYHQYAELLIEKSHAYYCFCSEEELELKKAEAEKENLAPHYDGKCRNISKETATNRLKAGEKAVIRFKAPLKSYTVNDHVRDRVVFPEGMVGDFVIIRSGGFPVYNYCCVIDDWLMKITHVIRAEEHLPNTLRQLMLYEALGATPPEFAHLSLLTGQDRQKLSKRHGATSVNQYKEEGYFPEAMVNYLSLLGWSHPEEKDIFDMEELKRVFGIDRFNKSPAIFDVEKLNWVNGQHLRKTDNETLVKECNRILPSDSIFHQQTHEWKLACLNLFKDKIDFIKDLTNFLPLIFSEELSMTDELKEILSWETTPLMKEYLKAEVQKINTPFVTEATLNEWSNHIKNELKIKGKPLFMGMRGCLTGAGHGPDLKFLIPLTPVSILKKRLSF